MTTRITHSNSHCYSTSLVAPLYKATEHVIFADNKQQGLLFSFRFLSVLFPVHLKFGIAGGSAIPVKEIQTVETDSSGALYVTSTPLIGVPGGSKFQAVAKLAVTNTADLGIVGCRVGSLRRSIRSRRTIREVQTLDGLPSPWLQSLGRGVLKHPGFTPPRPLGTRGSIIA